MSIEFSLTNLIRAVAARTWRTVMSYERGICDQLAEEYGAPEGNGIRIPDVALGVRGLSTAVPTAGGYLAPTQNLGYIAALQPASVALAMGATVGTVPANGNVAIPRGTAPIATTWLATESTAATETQPTFGANGSVPKTLTAYAEISRNLLLQTNAEQIIRLEFARAAGAALDAAIIAGSGVAGQPLGVLGTPNVGAFTGASLDRAALRNAQLDVNTATGVNAPTCGYITTPAVADLLANRARVANSDRMLWEGPSAEGVVEGCRAMATTGCTAATMVYGDWSRIVVLQWGGGLVLELDPFTRFKAGIIGVRLLMSCDVVVQQPAAFSVATSVS